SQVDKYGPADPATPLATFGSAGSGTNPPQFVWPLGLTLDSSGRLLVADSDNHRIMILDRDDGSYLASLGSYGSDLGEFDAPGGVAVDGFDNIYVADTNNGRIQKFTSSGTYLAEWDIPDIDTEDGFLPAPDGICSDFRPIRPCSSERHTMRVQRLRRSLLITAPQRGSGKSMIALGLIHLLERHLHSQVPSSHHDGVSLRNDLFKPIEGLGFFDLGDEHGLSLELVQDFERGIQIAFVSNERERHEVHMLLQSHLEVRAILFGQCRYFQVTRREVHSLARLEVAPHKHIADQAVSVFFPYDQLNPSIGEEHVVSGFNVIEQSFIVDGERSGITPLSGTQGHLLPGIELHLVAFEDSQTYFGASQVLEDPNLPSDLLRNLADHSNDLPMLVPRPV
ncbi:MAG: hypothetical protein HGA55_06180, partial [Methanoregulaceae archaeon]|nr:hypothetical protein [Methanoregulaceae archaeon]